MFFVNKVMFMSCLCALVPTFGFSFELKAPTPVTAAIWCTDQDQLKEIAAAYQVSANHGLATLNVIRAKNHLTIEQYCGALPVPEILYVTDATVIERVLIRSAEFAIVKVKLSQSSDGDTSQKFSSYIILSKGDIVNMFGETF